jgi:hypothetical protein
MSDSIPSIPLPRPHQDNSHTYQRNFVRYVMSDVFALLDFLSGRVLPPLASPSDGSARSLNRSGCANDSASQPKSDCMSVDEIEHNLKDNNLILYHAMRIAAQLDASNGNIRSANAAFLIMARDKFNVQAAPATGSSIAFTIRVVEHLLAEKTISTSVCRDRNTISDRLLDDVALSFAGAVRRWLC